jgi:hypothetical protein
MRRETESNATGSHEAPDFADGRSATANRPESEEHVLFALHPALTEKGDLL